MKTHRMRATTEHQRSSGLMGYSSLKPKPLDAIDAFLKGNDILVSLPTGYGKLLIFAMLPSLFNRLRERSHSSMPIVVSPLASLMLEQREVFTQVKM